MNRLCRGWTGIPPLRQSASTPNGRRGLTKPATPCSTKATCGNASRIMTAPGTPPGAPGAHPASGEPGMPDPQPWHSLGWPQREPTTPIRRGSSWSGRTEQSINVWRTQRCGAGCGSGGLGGAGMTNEEIIKAFT